MIANNDFTQYFSAETQAAYKESSPEIQKKISERLTSLTDEQTKEIASKILIGNSLQYPEAPLDPTIRPIVRMLLSHVDWKQDVNKDSNICQFLKSVLFRLDPEICLKTREWLQDRMKQAVNEIPNPQLRSIYIHNLLAYLPFFAPANGSTIELPFGVDNALVTYKIERVELTPSILGSPLVAYGLVPESSILPSILLLKGTTYPADEGAYFSVLTDVNPFAPVGGYAFHFSAKNRINRWLNAQPNKAELIGVSLGGGLALQTVCYFPEKIQSVHAFNSPAMTSHEIKVWNERTKDLTLKPQVNIYLQDKDDISAFAGRCWALDWLIYHVLSPVTNKIQAHAAAFTAHPKVCVIPGDPKIENSLRGRKLWPIVQNGLYIPIF